MKLTPTVTPETQHFWAGAARGELVLQRCTACDDVYFPPRPFCPQCASHEVRTVTASGRATLHTFTIVYRPRADWPAQPYILAIVDLEEGPRLLTNIVGCPVEPNAVRIGDPLVVDFESFASGFSVPVFRPAARGLNA
jgi:uncharacterized OB-fold protein